MNTDPKVIEFAEKLAALMLEYNAEFEVRENHVAYMGSQPDGIDINLTFPKDHEWNGSSFIELPINYIGADDITCALQQKQTR